MAVKYLENVVTTHFVSNNIEAIQAQHDNLLEYSKKTGPYQKNDIKNQVKLSEIQLNFAKANKLFYKKKFQEALKTYQYVQGLVFQLLYPPFKPWYIADFKLIAPVKAEMFNNFLKIGAEMAVSQPPEGIQSSVSYAFFKDLSGDVQKFAKSFDEIGVSTVADSVSNDVRNFTMLGLEYAKGNDWKNAELFFKQGLELMANAATSEAKIARASLELNLGAVYIQMGDFQSAQRTIKQAEQRFKENNDKAGEAQSKLNLAAILKKQGQTDKAAAMSREAEALLMAEDNSLSINTDASPETLSGGLSRFQPKIMSTFISKTMLGPVDTGTDIKPDTIFELASKKGAGVVFRLPAQGDGWITQDLESNIEKKQKLQAKEVGLSIGSEIAKFKWTENTGINLDEIKNNYYKKRVNLNSLEAVNIGYNLTTDIAVNLPHMYMYQLLVCIGDCYHYLGEFAKALEQYLNASNYQYINTNIELPALWIKIARNYHEWGNFHYRNENVQKASDVYVNVILANDAVPVNSPLYKDKLGIYGNQVAVLINNINNPDSSTLNPDTINLVLDVRNRLKMITAGLDYFGVPPNYFPIFKFDFLQSVASYFAQQAIQAEREYINFTSRGEDEEMTRQQLQQSIELSKAQVDLAQKQVEHTQAELNVCKENAKFADLSIQNAQAQKQQYANISYEITALEAATVFASGPEGYEVSYTYYSPSEGKDVTISGSDAYKVMEKAAWKKGMLSREMELSNMDRNIAELNANKQLANAQVQAAQVNVDVAVQQKKIAEMNQKHSEELFDSFESQIFTPEVWFQLGDRMLSISKTYLQRAIGIAKKMQKAYELETGRALNAIKNDYNTNIISGLLSADYLLSDINYFTLERINNSKSKDIPIKQMFSLAELNPIGFQTTFKTTGKVEFETNLSDFDLAYPGAYLRKIKKVEVIVEGLIPPGGVHGTLKNSGISRDRKENGDIFFRIQPFETLYLSNYNPRADVVIFQPDQRVLDVFENCGLATGWTLEISPAANDINYQTISDIKMIVYYTSQYNGLLEETIKAQLPKTGEKSTAFPFRLLFPDEYFNFIDNGELKFSLYSTDFAFNETELKVKNISAKIVIEEGISVQNLKFTVQQGAVRASETTNADGIIKSDKNDNSNPLNVFIDKEVCTEWIIKLTNADNAGLDRTKIKDLFFFVEYKFKYRG
ncbi:MAG: tetratricopeptide repeat protein [Candidatus Scalindua sp.]|nr:tetratricopeptide repeat protein [Candidatus Scalindua sp.]